MINFRVTRRDPVSTPSFSAQDMRTLADEANRQELSRLQRGQNINDAPAKPLSAPYARQKQRRGAAPVRNLSLTGSLLRSRSVIEAQPGEVTNGFTDAREQVIAQANERIDPMLGISPENQEAVDQRARQILNRKLQGNA